MDKDRHIGRELMTLSNRFRRFMDAQTAKFGITRMQSLVLRYLEKNPDTDVFQKDIEKAFCIRRSTATSLLQLMEKNGLINRESSVSDARMKRIVFTEKGKEIQQGMHNAVFENESAITRQLTEEETDVFFRICDKLNNYFITEENE